jgi:hypothetical protein
MPLFEAYHHLAPFLSTCQQPVDEPSELLRIETLEQFVPSCLFPGAMSQRLPTSEPWSSASGGVPFREGGLCGDHLPYRRTCEEPISLADMEACLEEEANDAGVELQGILGPVSGYGREAGAKLLPEVRALGYESIVGVTLARRAHPFALAEFADRFALAWDRDLRIPGAQGISHGVRPVEGQPVVQHLAEQEIPLGVSPTTNIRAGISSSPEAHPVKAPFDAGVPTSIPTDGPSPGCCPSRGRWSQAEVLPRSCSQRKLPYRPSLP